MLKLKVAVVAFLSVGLLAIPAIAQGPYGSSRNKPYTYSDQIKPAPLGGYHTPLGESSGGPAVYDNQGRRKGVLSTNPNYPSYPSSPRDFYQQGEQKSLLAPRQKLYIIPDRKH